MRRIDLRPLVPDDAEALRRITDDPVVISAISFLSAPFAIEDARALISGGAGDLFFGAWHVESGDLVGVVGTHLIGADEIEIGYWMATRYAGAGYASEAARSVIDLLMKSHPQRTIVAECRPQNAASWRVLEKLGFRPTGENGRRDGRKRLVLTSHAAR